MQNKNWLNIYINEYKIDKRIIPLFRSPIEKKQNLILNYYTSLNFIKKKKYLSHNIVSFSEILMKYNENLSNYNTIIKNLIYKEKHFYTIKHALVNIINNISVDNHYFLFNLYFCYISLVLAIKNLKFLLKKLIYSICITIIFICTHVYYYWYSYFNRSGY